MARNHSKKARVTELGPVGKADLKGYDEEATGLILWAQEKGARVKLSKRNHAILFAPSGRTAAIPRKLTVGNRTAQNTRAAVARLFREEDS